MNVYPLISSLFGNKFGGCITFLTFSLHLKWGTTGGINHIIVLVLQGEVYVLVSYHHEF